MSISPQKFREVLLQLLYSYDMGQEQDEEASNLIADLVNVNKTSVLKADKKVTEILSHLEEIDSMIAKVAVGYSIERIHSVERNILRLALFELLIERLVPPKVVIKEAIRLAKKFASPSSTSFINAILDQLYQEDERKNG